MQLPLEHLVPRFEPVQFARNAGPEAFGIALGFLIERSYSSCS